MEPGANKDSNSEPGKGTRAEKWGQFQERQPGDTNKSPRKQNSIVESMKIQTSDASQWNQSHINAPYWQQQDMAWTVSTVALCGRQVSQPRLALTR